MNERLVLKKERYLTRIAWFFPDDDDYGAMLGERADDIDPETEAIIEAVEPMASGRDAVGLYWDSLHDARKALAVAKAVSASAHSSRPVEEWETKALASGWKAPKGWR